MGQGRSASGPIWMVIAEVMIAAFERLIEGVQLVDPDNRKRYTNSIIAYVDDNITAHNYDEEVEISSIRKDAIEATNAWSHLIECTGGKLSKGKCNMCIVAWQWRGCRLELQGKDDDVFDSRK